jgi:H2-forming N5,N10-methylenetetrahydromethanopterin dehydrogenase-like enzyme
VERLAEGVEGAGADVTEDDAQGTEGGDQQITGSVFGSWSVWSLEGTTSV